MSESTENRKKNFYIAGSAVVSVMLSRLSFGSLIFCLPFLLVIPGIKKTRNAVLGIFVIGLAVTGCTLYECRALLENSSNLGILFIGVVFPIIGTVGCMVWTALRNYSNNVLRKLVLCSFATIPVALALAIWLSSFAGEEKLNAIIALYKAVIPEELFRGSVDAMARLVMSLIILMMVPFGMFFSAFQILISEFILHKADDDWQHEFAYMKMPNSYVWPFFIVWIVALGSNFVDFIPMWLSVSAWNIALGFSMHYLLSGVSVMTSFLRRKTDVSAGKVFFSVVAICLLPLINAVVFVGLAVLGVLETWYKFR